MFQARTKDGWRAVGILGVVQEMIDPVANQPQTLEDMRLLMALGPLILYSACAGMLRSIRVPPQLHVPLNRAIARGSARRAHAEKVAAQ